MIIAAAVILILVFALGYALMSYAMGIRRQTLAGARQWQEEHYDLSWFDPAEKTAYTLQGEDGYVLHALMIRNPAPSDRYVIISHGYTDNRFGALKYAKIWLDLGFNVIVYDLRGHGANDPTYCTYSLRESRDLLCVIRDARQRFSPAVLGLHGESLGAATTMAVLRYQPEVDFAVSDCGFSEIESVMKAGLRGMHLPGCLVHLASLCAKIFHGVFYHEMRPIDALKENRIPILFMHGEDDDFILPAHSEAMHQATQGYTELHLFPGAGHAASVLTDPETYRKDVEGFLAAVAKGGENA